MKMHLPPGPSASALNWLMSEFGEPKLFPHSWDNPGSTGARENEGLFSHELLDKRKAALSCPPVLELAFLATSHTLQLLESNVYSPVMATRARVSTAAFRNILGSSLGWDSLSYTGCFLESEETVHLCCSED